MTELCHSWMMLQLRANGSEWAGRPTRMFVHTQTMPDEDGDAYLTILASLLVFAWIEMLGLKCSVITNY